MAGLRCISLGDDAGGPFSPGAKMTNTASRPRSIERNLPLLISVLLLAVITVFAILVYGSLRQVAMRGAEDRVQAVAEELADLLGASAARLTVEAQRLAAEPSLARYLRSRDGGMREAAERTLEMALARTPQLRAIEVRDAAGRRVLTAGTIPAPLTSWSMPRPDSASGRDTHFSSLAATADGDTAFYATATPIHDARGRTLGSLVQYRRSGGQGGQGGQLIRDLIGTDALFLVGNGSGDLWTNLDHTVLGPRLARRAGGARTPMRDSVDGAWHIGAVAPIAPTPWVVWVGLPEHLVTAPAREMLKRMLLIGAVILLAGAASGWIVSRRITMPLREVTDAAEGMAAGDYSRRVHARRHDELGRLATAFNAMAAQVEGGHHALEERVAARTRELTTALQQLRDAQEELVRKEKLALIGQLAGSVGHELRNPLGVMTNAVHYLGLVLTDAPPTVAEYLGILRTQIGLAERIVGDLLDSARVKPPQREPVAVHPLLVEQLDRASVPDDIQVALDIAPDLPHACVDRVQIGQVLLNLVTNALQAMAGGGTLTLRAHPDGPERVRVEVIDTGGGIAPEHLEKIFEPLFTTKARGIGLGLSVARTLVDVNGGELTVASRPGAGATFTLLLPTLTGVGASA